MLSHGSHNYKRFTDANNLKTLMTFLSHLNDTCIKLQNDVQEFFSVKKCIFMFFSRE